MSYHILYHTYKLLSLNMLSVAAMAVAWLNGYKY